MIGLGQEVLVVDADPKVQRGIAKVGSSSGQLRKVARIEARTSVVDEQRTIVRLLADRRSQRTEAVAGGSAIGGAGLVVGGATAFVAVPIAAVVAPVGIVVGVAVARGAETALLAGAVLPARLAAQPAAASPSTAGELAAALQKKYDTVRDFSADFEHVYTGGVLRKQLTANGSDDIQPAWSPTDPNIVLAGTDQGLFRSLDGGTEPTNVGVGAQLAVRYHAVRLRHLAPRRGRRIAAVDARGAGARRHQPRRQPRHRGLARAVGPHQRHQLAARHRQRHAAHHRASVVAERHVCQREHARWYHAGRDRLSVSGPRRRRARRR